MCTVAQKSQNFRISKKNITEYNRYVYSLQDTLNKAAVILWEFKTNYANPLLKTLQQLLFHSE